jgi:hypothetical protein
VEVGQFWHLCTIVEIAFHAPFGVCFQLLDGIAFDENGWAFRLGVVAALFGFVDDKNDLSYGLFLFLLR